MGMRLDKSGYTSSKQGALRDDKNNVGYTYTLFFPFQAAS